MSWIIPLMTASWISLANLCFATSSEASKEWGPWKEARTFYDSKKFDDSLKEFQLHPRDDASYHYNLGTVYYRLGKLGASLAHLEKANRIHPHETDIQHNLSVVRNSLVQSIGLDKLDAASTWSEQIADRLSLEEVRAALGLLGTIAVLLWIRAYLKTRDIRKTLLAPNALIAFMGFGLAFSVYCIQRLADASPPAISLTKQTIRSGPGDHYLDLSETEEGAKLRILGPTATAARSAQTSENPNKNAEPNLELWRQVRYSPDGIGWVKASNLLVL